MAQFLNYRVMWGWGALTGSCFRHAQRIPSHLSEAEGGSMVKAGRSFSQTFIPQNETIPNSGDGGAFDVAALLAAVGGEQMQYIEFNGVRRELETRQRWPLLHIVSEMLDKPERPVDVAKPVVLHKEGAAI